MCDCCEEKERRERERARKAAAARAGGGAGRYGSGAVFDENGVYIGGTGGYVDENGIYHDSAGGYFDAEGFYHDSTGKILSYPTRVPTPTSRFSPLQILLGTTGFLFALMALLFKGNVLSNSTKRAILSKVGLGHFVPKTEFEGEDGSGMGGGAGGIGGGAGGIGGGIGGGAGGIDCVEDPIEAARIAAEEAERKRCDGLRIDNRRRRWQLED